MKESQIVRVTVLLGVATALVIWIGVVTTIDTYHTFYPPVVKRVLPDRTPAQTTALLKQLLPLPKDFKYVSRHFPSDDDVYDQVHFRSVNVDFPTGLSAKAQDDNLRAVARQIYKDNGVPVIAWGFEKGEGDAVVAKLTFGPETGHWNRPNSELDLSEYKAVIERSANVPDGD
jgi:hypothetical protein